MFRRLVFGLVAVTALCSTVVAEAQPYPRRVREVRLIQGETIRALSIKNGDEIRVTCEGGYDPDPGYPRPMPPRARQACVVMYNAPSQCGLYTIFVDGAPMTGCIGSIDQVTDKVGELERAGVCERNRMAPPCELKYNAPSQCGLYTVFAAGRAVTGCIGSVDQATQTIQKLRAAGACY